MSHTANVSNNWQHKFVYSEDHFPEDDLEAAENYCRNPKPTDYRTWCYYRLGAQKKWDYCSLRKCGKNTRQT